MAELYCNTRQHFQIKNPRFSEHFDYRIEQGEVTNPDDSISICKSV